MVTCLATAARSCGSTPKLTLTGAATPTTASSAGLTVFRVWVSALTVVQVPGIGTCLPSVPVAVPVTV